MRLQDYAEAYNKLRLRKCLSGAEALEAVKQNGYALLYVGSNMFNLKGE
jgi:hypothetical protein